jgi:hypothetical protein
MVRELNICIMRFGILVLLEMDVICLDYAKD